jgi:hypothetical protein
MDLNSKKVIILLGISVAVSMVGCATAPLATEASTSGIRAAEEVGATQVPQAALHLQLAKEELMRAEKLASNDEKDMADSMLQRAEVDAELAVLLSREDMEKSEAKLAMERVQKLQKDNK